MKGPILWALIAGTGLVLGASACSEGPLVGSDARVRFVNASPVRFEVLRHGTLIAGGIDYALVSNCITVNPSSHGLALQFQNGPTVSVMEGFNSGDRATIVVTRHGSGTQAITQLISLFLTSTPASGQSGFRVVNASGSGPYDVYVTAPSAPLGSPLAVAVSSGAHTAFIDIPEGTMRARVAAAGTQTVVVDAGTRFFPAGLNTTFVIAPPEASGSAVQAFFVHGGNC